jgi:hypothetical protein
MIEFMKSNYYDPISRNIFIPRKHTSKIDADKDFIFNETEADLNNKFDKWRDAN